MRILQFVNNPVKVTMIFAGMVIMGVLSFYRLPLNLFPDIQTPRITLLINTVDLTPELAERKVTKDLEQKLSSIKGVSNITSHTRENTVVIYVDFHWGENMEFAYLDVKKNAGVIQTEKFIESVEVFRFDPNAAPLLTLVFHKLENRINISGVVETSLEAKLETIEGVAYVKANGLAKQEVVVTADESLLDLYELTLDQVVEEVKRSSISSPGGVVFDGRQRMFLRYVNQFNDIKDIEQCVIKNVNGFPVHLRDLGPVELKRMKEDMLVRENGRQTISIDIFKEPDANAVFTAKRVREFVKSINSKGKYGLKIAVDRSIEIEASIQEVIKTATVGMLLAVLVLLVFLRNLPATFIVAAAIPISIIATMSLMYFQSLSLNIMTLGGLALAAGLIVDNGIVVVENVFRKRQEGLRSVDAAVEGTKEVALAICASTLTTIVVFVPLVYVHGIAGIIFKDQALTVVYALLISLLVALVLVPMLVARIGRSQKTQESWYTRLYDKILKISMKARWMVLLLFIGVMFLTLYAGKNLKSEFFPDAATGRIALQIELPPGSTLRQTQHVIENIENQLQKITFIERNLRQSLNAYLDWTIRPKDEIFINIVTENVASLADKELTICRRLSEILKLKLEPREKAEQLSSILSTQVIIKAVISTLGVDKNSIQAADEKIHGENTARIEVILNTDLVTTIKARHISSAIRSVQEANPEVKILFESRNEFLQQMLGKNSGDLSFEVHSVQLDALQKSAALASKAISQIEGFKNIQTNLFHGEEEYTLIANEEAMVRDGFTSEDFSKQVQAFLQGKKTDLLRLQDGEMAVSIRRSQLADGLNGLMNLMIISKSGRKKKVEDLMKLGRKISTREIMRVNQEKTLRISADLDGIGYQQALKKVENKLNQLQWEEGATWNVSGVEIRRRQSFNKLFFALMLAILLVYMVIASILESIIHPLTIMLTVPLALSGVVAAFLLCDLKLNLMGYIGIVMLVGIVVNNAIVLLDRIHQIRRENSNVFESVIAASRQRLRPILMTSLTTVLALLPLAIGYGMGAELRRPMAIAVIGGITSSTLLTLWFLPCIYLCVEDCLNFMRRIFRKEIEA